MNTDLRSPARLVLDSVSTDASIGALNVEQFIEDLTSFSPTDLAELFVETALEKVRATQAGEKSRASRLAKLSLTLIAYIEIEEPETIRAVLRSVVSQMNSHITALAVGTKSENDSAKEIYYRAFDQLDELLGLDYSLDENMTSSKTQTERLYEGAGIGVQTSYASILMALDRVQMNHGAKVVDLGSGYGRVGFAIGLLRPDLEITGYEYVPHRVDNANEAAKAAGLDNVRFVTQDLAAADFKIPKADVFYMYDPFSRETYGYVLDQLIEMGRTTPITVITKGRANDWVTDALKGHGWQAEASLDSGTVFVFNSPSSAHRKLAPPV